MTDCVYKHIGDDGVIVCDNYSNYAHGIITFCEQKIGCVGKKPTNADKIRAMSDEELSEFLCGLHTSDDCHRCIAYRYCARGHTGMIDWLKKECDE